MKKIFGEIVEHPGKRVGGGEAYVLPGPGGTGLRFTIPPPGIRQDPLYPLVRRWAGKELPYYEVPWAGPQQLRSPANYGLFPEQVSILYRYQ